jgi:hypothetical protein
VGLLEDLALLVSGEGGSNLDGQNELVTSLGFTSPLPLVCDIRKANCQELADLLFAISV